MSKLDDIIDRPMTFIESQTGEDVRGDFKKQILEFVKGVCLEVIGDPLDQDPNTKRFLLRKEQRASLARLLEGES